MYAEIPLDVAAPLGDRLAMLVPALTGLALLSAASAMPARCLPAGPLKANGDLVVQRRSGDGLWLVSPAGRTARRLTPRSFPGRHDYGLSFSPDHRRIAFVHLARARPARWQLRTYDIATHRSRVIRGAHRGEQYDGLSWSPDGRRLAVYRETGASGPRPAADVALLRPDGRGFRSLYPEATEPGFPPPLAWSPNGRCLAFEVGGIGTGTIAVAPSDGDFGQAGAVWRTGMPLPDGRTGSLVDQVAFAPDGRRLFVADQNGRDLRDRIYSFGVVRPGPETAEAPVTGPATSPVPSPDGRRLAYYAYRRNRAFVVPVGGGTPRALGRGSVLAWWAKR